MTEKEYLDTEARTYDDDRPVFRFYRLRGGSSVRFLPGAGAKLHFANRDSDTCSFGDVPVGFFQSGDTLRVSYGDVTVFSGSLSKRTKNRGKGGRQQENVVFAGPWEAMKRMVYRQRWMTQTGLQLSSRLVLNQAESGNPQNLNLELTEILNHAAASCGYTVSPVNVSAKYLPYDECRDITIADAIDRELRFFPKATVRFDYATGAQPAIIIERKANDAEDVAYVETDVLDIEREYNENPITGVDLQVETTVTVPDGDGESDMRVIHHQTAGDTSAQNINCLYATVQLQGADGSATTNCLEAETEDIPDDLTSDYTWWLDKHPYLANWTNGEIRISNAKRSGEADKEDYPRFAKNTADELESAGLKSRVETFTCTAHVACGTEEEEDVELSMQFLTTNAKTRKYTWTVSSNSQAGETCPDGLAEAILKDRSGTLMNEKITIRLRDTFPKIGDRYDGLFLQAVDIDCDNMVATLSFGQPEHLSVEDMASMLAGFRNRKRPSTAVSRYTGKPSDDKPEVELGGIRPLSSTEWSPGKKVKTEIGSKDPGSNHITIDASKPPEEGAAPEGKARSAEQDQGQDAPGGGDIELKTSMVEKGKTLTVRRMTMSGTGDGGRRSIQILATEDIDLEGIDLADRSCFRITSSVRNEQARSVTVTFGNCFYRKGACIEHMADGQEVTLHYSSSPDDEQEHLFICLKLNAASAQENLGGADEDGQPGDEKTDSAKTIFAIYASTEEMWAASRSMENVIIPLYAIGNDGNVMIDLRNAPTAQMWETL